MIPEQFTEKLPALLADLERRMPGAVREDLHISQMIASEDLDTVLNRLMDRLVQHYPFHQPFYAGQMLKPPHPAAWLAYSLAMTINPNNHALDGGPEASVMEKEVIQQLIAMTGLPNDALGHLTSSGTIANLEALWVAREEHPDRPIGITSQAHYTHRRMCHVLRHPVVEIPDNEEGVPDPRLLDNGSPLPGTVVVTTGTTGLGRVEPLHRFIDWAEKHGVRVHADAAYGGFFHLLRDSGLIDPEPWNVLSRVDSMVIDPHKHGLQPYGCGSVLFRDPFVGRFFKHDSPYTYFSSDELHLGEISLECSRAGSAAIALWVTLQLLPLNKLSGEHFVVKAGSKKDGEKGKGLPDNTLDEADKLSAGSDNQAAGLAGVLASCRMAALDLYEKLLNTPGFHPVMRPELDIVAFIPETGEKRFSAASDRTEAIFRKGMEGSPENRLYLSTLEIEKERAVQLFPDWKADREGIRVLRSVLMKPEHHDFIPEMVARLETLHQQTRI